MVVQKKLGEEKGITLMILVVTIIVILMIAGATINLVVGDGGILDQIKETERVRNEQIAQQDNETNEIVNEADEEIKNIWKDSSGANPPKLTEEMVPVKWDESVAAWVVTNSKDSEWFDYSKKKWANVMLRDGLKVSGVKDATTASLSEMQGEEVLELGSMFVWIPRYGYQIESRYHSNSVGVVNIEFMIGKTDISSKGRIVWNNESGEGNWNVHPAFQYDGAVEGIWVAKFEASSVEGNSNTPEGDDRTSKTLQIKPGVPSWRYISVGTAYTVCSNYRKELNSHLTKNTEWSAVAYLAESDYGKNDIIWTNPNSSYITGQAGKTYLQSSTTQTYDYDNNIYGVKASTTGNIYGIYDMAGGAWEETAAYIDNKAGEDSLELYAQSLKNAPDYAKDVYAASTEDTQRSNYIANKAIYGDAIWETSCLESNAGKENGNFAWHDNFVDFPYSDVPIIYRGGSCNDYGGIYSIGRNTGDAGDERHGFRVVLIP